MESIKDMMRPAPGVIPREPLLIKFAADLPVIMLHLGIPGEKFFQLRFDPVAEFGGKAFDQMPSPRIILLRKLPQIVRIEPAVVGIREKAGDPVPEINREVFVIFLIDELAEIIAAFGLLERGKSPRDIHDFQPSFRIGFQTLLSEGWIGGFDPAGGFTRRIIETVVDPQLQFQQPRRLDEPFGNGEPEIGKITQSIKTERRFIEKHNAAISEVLHPLHGAADRLRGIIRRIDTSQKIKRDRTETVKFILEIHNSILLHSVVF